jgi:hypothetical protein
VTKVTSTLHEDHYTSVIISRSVLRMRNFSYKKSCTENQNKSFVFNNSAFRKSCHLWDNVEKYCTAGQDTDDYIAQEQWLHELASVLQYMHIASLVLSGLD